MLYSWICAWFLCLDPPKVWLSMNILCLGCYFQLSISWGRNSDILLFSSVQFSRSVVSDSLWPHELQHARPPCPSPTPGVHSDSRPSSQWCHPAISSSVVPFYSCSQSLPASESFLMSQLFTRGGQSFNFSIIPSKEIPGLISFILFYFLHVFYYFCHFLIFF